MSLAVGSMEARAWDLAGWYANPARADAALGWKAKIDLADGLEAHLRLGRVTRPTIDMAIVDQD